MGAPGGTEDLDYLERLHYRDGSAWAGAARWTVRVWRMCTASFRGDSLRR